MKLLTFNIVDKSFEVSFFWNHNPFIHLTQIMKKNLRMIYRRIKNIVEDGQYRRNVEKLHLT